MVNYCCVYGCGRNSRSHGYLTFYTLPKEESRKLEWIKAGCPELLGEDLDSRSLRSRRFCSRHFAPACIRNQRLLPNAIPTLCLTGSDTDEVIACPQTHPELVCNGCGGPIVGFRYKCTECKDFDLCQRCETHETHSDHAMLRLPRPVDAETARNLTKNWSGDATENIEPKCESSDDEPITKYRNRKRNTIDCNWTLSKATKNLIRQEVMRAIKASKLVQNKKTEAAKPLKRHKKPTRLRNAAEVEDNVENIEAQPTEYFTPKDNTLELPIEFASVDSERSYPIETQEECKPILEASLEARQSAMDIVNDSLSEFLIRKI